MKILSKVLVALIAVLMGAVWLQITVVPQNAAAQFHLITQGPEGLNTLRADIGGLFLSGCLFAVLGLRDSGRHWLLAAAFMMAAAAAGRIIGIAVDGVSALALQSTALEIVLLAILLFAYRMSAAR